MDTTNNRSAKRTCIASPNASDGYRFLAKQCLEDTSRLLEIGNRLIVLGADDVARAILRICYRRANGGTAALEPLRSLAARTLYTHYSPSEFTILKNILLYRIEMYEYYHHNFIELMIRIAKHKNTQNAVLEVTSYLNNVNFTIQQILTIVRMLAKVKHSLGVQLGQELVQQIARKPGALPETQLTVAKAYLWAVLNCEGASSLPRFVQKIGVPFVDTSYADGYESLYLFSIGKPDEAIRLGKNLSQDLGLVFNGIRLYPSTERASAIVEQIGSNKDLPCSIPEPQSIGLIVSCDPVYLEKFGIDYVRNLRSSTLARCRIKFYIDGKVAKEVLDAVCAASSIPVQFEISATNVKDTAFYTIRRFLELPKILKNNDIAISTDIDGVLDLSDDEFVHELSMHAGGWHDTGSDVPWLRNSADFVYFTNTRAGDWGARCLSRLCLELYSEQGYGRNWFCDQVYISAFWDQVSSSDRSLFHHIVTSDLLRHFQQYDAFGLSPEGRLDRKSKKVIKIT
jgi:hypothetical protein